MNLYELIEEVLKNIDYLKNNNMILDFNNNFLKPYLNTVRYKMLSESLENFINSGSKYDIIDNYNLTEKYFKNHYFKKISNDFIIKNLLDYEQLEIINKTIIKYKKELNNHEIGDIWY